MSLTTLVVVGILCVFVGRVIAAAHWSPALAVALSMLVSSVLVALLGALKDTHRLTLGPLHTEAGSARMPEFKGRRVKRFVWRKTTRHIVLY